MFSKWFGLFFVVPLCLYNKAQGSLSIANRTSIALAGETLHYRISVTVPANKSNIVRCFKDGVEVWKADVKRSTAMTAKLWANITVQNSSDSGEYYISYESKERHWVVLVRDVGYCEPDMDLPIDIISLLVLSTVLLVFSVSGSVYVIKWHKDHPLSGEGGEGTKVNKRESNTDARDEAPPSDSVYTALEPRPVSIYDVLGDEEGRGINVERLHSEETAKTAQEEEEMFESVYENL
ncbi:NFAT activation molecule 1 [Brachyhypopomus gauderio]|uniref:NFAT activation molecule 1 n=1 Tax=Brachyhypopomus gauderio TaxID=698409 RepID=UPI0040427D89